MVLIQSMRWFDPKFVSSKQVDNLTTVFSRVMQSFFIEAHPITTYNKSSGRSALTVQSRGCNGFHNGGKGGCGGCGRGRVGGGRSAPVQ